MPHRLVITAPSRLHFGLYGLGRGTPRQYGGVGMMIAEPALQMEATAAEAFSCDGPAAERVREFAQKRQAFFGDAALPACRIRVLAAPPAHAGLGSGTQTALATVALINAWTGRENGPPEQLARIARRGGRSAVGTYGFSLGGLIAERGHLEGEPFPPLDARLDVRPEWRFVLLQPPVDTSVFGVDEEERIAALPPVPSKTTEALIRIAREDLLPAAAAGDFSAFAAAVHRFNHDSGMLFAPAQGGPYHGSVVTGWIETCRRLGGIGVGQSSWGPTIFVVQPSQHAADQFVAAIRCERDAARLRIRISPPCNTGAELRKISA